MQTNNFREKNKYYDDLMENKAPWNNTEEDSEGREVIFKKDFEKKAYNYKRKTGKELNPDDFNIIDEYEYYDY